MSNIGGETNFVVQYRDSPTQISGLILITRVNKLIHSEDLLNWYAIKYDIERSKLSGYFIDCVNFKE